MSGEERAVPVTVRWQEEGDGLRIWSDDTGRSLLMQALDWPPRASGRPPLYRLTRSDGRTIAGELWPLMAQRLALRWVARGT